MYTYLTLLRHRSNYPLGPRALHHATTTQHRLVIEPAQGGG